MLSFKYSSTLSQENGKKGFNNVLILNIIFTILYKMPLHSSISSCTRIQGFSSSKYLFAKFIKSNILLIASLQLPSSISLPTSSYNNFNLLSISVSISASFNFPLKDLLINFSVLLTRFPHLPKSSPLWELIKSSQEKLKSFL